ncbi:MAG: preprotein translocase subunit YajC [Acutalibacteraceae bacterium]
MRIFYYSVQTLKEEKEEANRKNAKIGDEITTIGGIVGRIVAVKDDSDTIIIETGTDRQRLRLKRWAISSVETPLDRVQQAATESSENKPAEKKGLFGRKKEETKPETKEEK